MGELIVIWLVFTCVFMWSLCRIAAESDEALDRERRP